MKISSERHYISERNARQAQISAEPARRIYGEDSLQLSFDSRKGSVPDFNQIKKGAILKRGDQGKTVKLMQQRLTQLGFGVQLTGIFGPTTEKVLQSFQRAYRVEPTGRLGPTTLGILEKVERTSATSKSKLLASKAHHVAKKRGTVGWCYNAVYHAITPLFGDFLRGQSAFMAASQLAKHPAFKELKVSAQHLPRLKAGAVVVWGRSARSPHGHISISLGNGWEASDHIERQRTHLRGDKHFRVFVPE